MNTKTTVVEVKRDIRAERLAEAARFRDANSQRGTLVVRLISSPGAGKTSLLQQTARVLGAEYRVGILVGDVETERDAERLAPYAPSVQITTGGACHLEIELVQKKFPDLGSQPFDFLFIEDVGNLICPASHDLGEHLRVILLSTTEGDDKPGKYPKAFRTSQVLIISKTDLLPYVPFSVSRAVADAQQIQPELTVFPLSAYRQEGLEPWCKFLQRTRQQILEQPEGSADVV
jgi:hydrogenase nickel incorporation protein HypB